MAMPAVAVEEVVAQQPAPVEMAVTAEGRAEEGPLDADVDVAGRAEGLAEVAPAPVDGGGDDAQQSGEMKAPGRPKGRGKAKGKAKGKAAARDKAKAKAKTKTSFSSQAMRDLGERDLDDALAAAAAQVEACTNALEDAELEEGDAEAAWKQVSAKVSAAAAKVEACVAEESAALENLRVARASTAEAAAQTRRMEVERAEVAVAAKILDLDNESRERLAELEGAQKAARDAAEAARQRLEESKTAVRVAKEQVHAARSRRNDDEVLAICDEDEEAGKNTAAEAKKEAVWHSKTRTTVGSSCNQNPNGQLVGTYIGKGKSRTQMCKEQKTAERVAQRETLAEFARLDKLRAQRNKERHRKLLDAAGLGRGVRKFAAIAEAPNAAGDEGAKKVCIEDAD